MTHQQQHLDIFEIESARDILALPNVTAKQGACRPLTVLA